MDPKSTDIDSKDQEIWVSGKIMYYVVFERHEVFYRRGCPKTKVSPSKHFDSIVSLYY